MFYDKRNEATISTLCPTAQTKARQLLAECDKQGIWLLFNVGYRSWAMQLVSFTTGSSGAKPGYSFHQYRVALDFVPTDAQGKLHYEDTNRINQIAAIAKSQGWEWSGDWPPIPKVGRETDHLQYTSGHDIYYFRNGGTI